MRLLLPAGVETTYRSLGNLLFALLSNPDQLDAVRADRSLLPQAIEEAVRWEPPLIMITRVASRDTELGGVQIPAGSSVMPMLGAANRQDERFPTRTGSTSSERRRPNIGWGHGVHVCLGMHLARLEMRVALNLLFDRLPNLRLDPDGRRPAHPRQAFRSPTSVPVLFDPACSSRADAKAPDTRKRDFASARQINRPGVFRDRLRNRRLLHRRGPRSRPVSVLRSSAVEMPCHTGDPVQCAGGHRIRGGAGGLQGPGVLIVHLGGGPVLGAAVRSRRRRRLRADRGTPRRRSR